MSDTCNKAENALCTIKYFYHNLKGILFNLKNVTFEVYARIGALRGRLKQMNRLQSCNTKEAQKQHQTSWNNKEQPQCRWMIPKQGDVKKAGKGASEVNKPCNDALNKQAFIAFIHQDESHS